MPKHIPTFFDHSKAVALKFLHTVVVVDDRAAFGQEPEETVPVPEMMKEPEVGGEPVKDATTEYDTNDALNELKEDAEATDSSDDESHKLDAKKLIDTFAEHSLICAVIKPTENDTVDDQVLAKKTLKAAHRADIVVLDWQLKKDNGKHARQLIKMIIPEDQKIDGRLRLIVIYTGDRRLLDIVDKVKTDLKDRGLQNAEGEGGDFVLTNGQARVAIFAKEGTELPAEQLSRRCTISDLPDTLVTEFAKMTGGLVSNVAVGSFAALRENTHRILSRMHANLDGPFLAHRALLPMPNEASDHLVGYLSAELRSILDEYEVGENVSLEKTGMWLSDAEAAGHVFTLECPDGDAMKDVIITKEEASKLMEKGLEKWKPTAITQSEMKQYRPEAYKTLTRAFCNPVISHTDLDSEFAILTSLRTRLGLSLHSRFCCYC